MAVLGGVLCWFLVLTGLSLVGLLAMPGSDLFAVVSHVVALGAGTYGFFFTRSVMEARRASKRRSSDGDS